jgi:LysM repeat protein
MPPVNKNYYVIRSSSGVSVTVLRGMDAPTITGGGGRWTVVPRPRRRSEIQWDGDDPYTMDVSIMFDGWIDDRNVERDIQRVNQMMHSQGQWLPPVTVRIAGALPVKGGVWVITGIDYGTTVLWDADKHGRGFRYRQDAVLHLLQYLPETVLQFNRKPGTTTPYRVSVGDTIASIAAKWRVTPAMVTKKNNIRDPKKIKVGQRLLIPPSPFGPYPLFGVGTPESDAGTHKGRGKKK